MKSARYFLAGSWLLFFSLFVVVRPLPVEAYIGPGAGFAFVSSFFILAITFFLAFLTLLTWPIRWLIQSFRRRKLLEKARVKRVVVLGLDGQDPKLTDQYLGEGLLPHFAKLRDQGSYTRLATTLPAESPVAWSSFQTGCNPGRHRVFDFLVPNRKSYLPELCSAKINPPSRTLKLGKYRIPFGKTRIHFGRKSQSFWKILSDHGVFSSVLRVPITFPPERFNGLLLSAMPVPDLKGTQGTFSYYSSDRSEHGKFQGGMIFPVKKDNGVVRSFISGPENSFRTSHSEMRIPFEAHLGRDENQAQLVIDKKTWTLPLRRYSPWISLTFRAGLGFKVQGICRFYLKELTPHFKLYMSPLNINPEKPALPISHPLAYSVYLSRTQGSFNTLGLAEDTWALNEGILDENAFLEQTYLVHQEREKMFFDALEKTKRGVVVCVFDITDRVQHMFWRYFEEDHPANRGKDIHQHRQVIREMYRRMDDLVGRVIQAIDEDTLLVVMSDHGFTSFRRGVNLNSWLYENGFLSLKDRPAGAEWFQGVDWTKTKAYAVGLGGIYLNLKGREAKGIVRPGQEEGEIKQQIIEGLRRLYDEQGATEAVREVYDSQRVYEGPYTEDAPDLIVGFSPGYRASWSCATGAVTENVFEENTKRWSGDHCVNPPDVQGIFFCNRKVQKQLPSIMDVGPTVLDLFGVPIPSYCDGESVFAENERGAEFDKNP